MNHNFGLTFGVALRERELKWVVHDACSLGGQTVQESTVPTNMG